MTLDQLCKLIYQRQADRVDAGEGPLEQMFITDKDYAEVIDDIRRYRMVERIPERCCGVVVLPMSRL